MCVRLHIENINKVDEGAMEISHPFPVQYHPILLPVICQLENGAISGTPVPVYGMFPYEGMGQ
jgi:hypothetical protein